MNAVDYFKEKARMANKCNSSYQNCSQCGLSKKNNGSYLYCKDFEYKYPEKAVEIVEKWSREHHKKTYSDDFKEKFPNACLDKFGKPTLCKGLLYFGERLCVLGKQQTCKMCWNEEYKEDKK